MATRRGEYKSHQNRHDRRLRRTVWMFLTALLPKVAAVLLPTRTKPPSVVAPDATVVVTGDVAVVLCPLAMMRPPPEIAVV